MAANNETRTLKSNTLEEFRQKSNEVSLHLGDNALIDSRILDKTVSYTATASQTLFTGSGLRFELKPEETLDDVVAGESFSVGVLQVFKDGTELSQGLTADDFKVPNFVGSITLSNISSAADVDEFVEDAVIYQGSSLASATWPGTVLDCTTTLLRLKTKTGTFSASTLIKVNGGTDTIVGANHGDINATDSAYGVMIELNTAASAGEVIKVVSTNVIDAVNEVQDDIGDITTLAAGIPSKADVVDAINSFKGEVGNAVDLNTTAQVVVAAINEHETDIGSMSLNTTATDLTAAINEHDAELGTITAGAFGTTASIVSTAIAELHTDVDARLFLTKGSQQTLDSDVTFTNGNTLVFPAGSTLDIRNGLLQTGSGGLSVSTAFIDFNSDLNERGLSFERSDFGNGVDVKLIWDEVHATTQPDRGFRVIGLNTGATTETADLVTFYNAQDLIANNTETGINVTWDSTNQNFDFALTADPTISLSGDLSGSVALTNLATSTFTLTATIGSGVVENSMLAGSISASKLAGGIGNSLLTNSSITVSDGSNTSPIALGGTLTFSNVSGVTTVTENAGTVTIGLPDDVTIGNDLTVTGDLIVQGDTVTLNTETLTVEDTLVLAGNNLVSEPSSGGFGLEVGPITNPSGVAAGVTGAHSIVYNYANDRWEADGSLILSDATFGRPDVSVNNASPLGDLGSDNTLDFNAGSGITIGGALNTLEYDITITNSDRGSSQNIFKNVASDSGTAVADNNNDTLTITGGNNLTTSVSSDTLTIQHDNSGVSAGSYGSRFVVPTITVDARGHVTGVSNNSSITLASLGYSGSTTADNYGSFNIRANTAASTAIGSGETITFTDSGATTVTRSGNTIDISSVNTQYSVGDGGLTQVNFTTTRRDKLDGIAASANNYSWQYDTSGNGSNQTVSNGNVIRIQGSGATSVTHSGSTITISSTDTNTDTNTITNIGVNNANYTNGNINFQASGAASISKSGNTVTISSTNTTYSVGNGGLTEINFTSALNSKLAGIAAGATNVTNNNQLTNGAGYTTYSSNQTLNNNSNVHFEGLMVGQTSGSTANTIRCVGDVVAFYSSDKRLKDNITPIENSLEKVGKLKGYEFDWNDNQEVYEGHDVGVIAQEVEAVVPEIVETRKHDGYKAVKYEKLVPLLINAINELKAEIEELKVINKGIEK